MYEMLKFNDKLELSKYLFCDLESNARCSLHSIFMSSYDIPIRTSSASDALKVEEESCGEDDLISCSGVLITSVILTVVNLKKMRTSSLHLF